MSNVNRQILFLIFTLISQWAFGGSPNLTTIQTRINKPGGAPLEASSVNFRFTILDSVGTCALYVEDYPNVNMSGSQGIVSFNLGSGTKQFPIGTVGMHDVFNNSTPSFNCQAGGTYSPGTTDRRQIVMQFNDGNGWQTLPQMAINSVYYSIYATRAEFLGAYPANDYLRAAAFPTCTGSQVLTFNGASFTCVAGSSGGMSGLSVSSPLVLSGSTSTPILSLPAASATSGGYLTSADWTTFNNKASATLTSGQLYMGNGSNAATGVVVSGDATLANTGVMTLANSGVTAGAYGSVSAVPTFTVDAKGRVTSATSQAYQNATNAAKGVVQIGSNISLNSGVISVTSSDVTNALGYTPADAAGGAFVNGGNAVLADATLGVNSNFGLILKTNNTARMTITNAGNLGIGTTSPVYKLDVVGDVNVSGNFKVNGVNIATGSGTVTSVTAATTAGNPIVVGGTAATPTVGLPAATSSVNGYLSSSDWSTFNSKIDGSSLNASNLSSGTVPAARFPALSGDVSSAAGSVNLTVDKIKGKAVVPVAYSAGQVLRYDGTNWVNNNLSMFDLRSTVTGTATFGSGSTGCASNQTLTWTAATDNLSCTNISLPAGQVTGTLAIANGGTGATTQAAAANAILPTQTSNSGKYLTTDGTNVSWSSLSASQWTTTGSDIYYNTGKVGIGTSTPDGKLHITSGSTWTSSSWLKGLRLDGINTVEFGGGASTRYGMGASSGTFYIFDTNAEDSSGAANYRFSINGGNVSVNNGLTVGTGLTVGGTANGKIYQFGDYAGSGELASGSYVGNTGTGSYNILASTNGTAGGKVTIGYYNQSAFYSAAEVASVSSGYSNLLLMKSGGSVGIGAASPSEKLTVGGNIALSTANSKLTGATGLTLESTGDTYGTVRLNLQNRSGVNGAMFEQAGSVDLVDFVFKGLSNQSNIRYENRGSSIVYGAPEFQIGPPTASGTYFVVSGTAVGVTNNRPLMVGPFISNAQSAVTISGPAVVGQLIRANASQTADIFQAQTSGGSVLFNITSGGNVGIGTTPGYKLDVNGDANIASGSALRFGGTQVCTSSGCTASSDIRLKENIQPLENALEKILRIEGVDYDYRDKKQFSDRHQIGVIAQQVEAIYPEVVVTDQKTGLKSVAYDHLVAPIIESIKSLYGYFKNLENRQVEIRREVASKADQTETNERFKKLEQENALLKEYICQKDPQAKFCGRN